MKHKEILRLSIEEMPRSYYNIAADLKIPLSPPLHPATKEPIGPEDLAPSFTKPVQIVEF